MRVARRTVRRRCAARAGNPRTCAPRYDPRTARSSSSSLYLSPGWRGDLGPSISYKATTAFRADRDRPAGQPAARAHGAAVGDDVRRSARRRRGGQPELRADHLIASSRWPGIAVLSLITAPPLTLVFGVTLKWLPVAGWGDGARVELHPAAGRAGLPQLAVIARPSRRRSFDVRADRTSYAPRAPRPARMARDLGACAASDPRAAGQLPRPAVAGVMTGLIVIEQIFGLPASAATSGRVRCRATIRWCSAW